MPPRDPPHDLSRVFHLHAQGLDTALIAKRLGMSRQYITRTLKKRREQLAPPPPQSTPGNQDMPKDG